METSLSVEISKQLEEFQANLSTQLELSYGQRTGWFAAINSGLLGSKTLIHTIKSLVPGSWKIEENSYSEESEAIIRLKKTLLALAEAGREDQLVVLAPNVVNSSDVNNIIAYENALGGVLGARNIWQVKGRGGIIIVSPPLSALNYTQTTRKWIDIASCLSLNYNLPA